MTTYPLIKPLRWLRINLFSSPFNIFLTLLSSYFLYITLPPLLSWLILDANWSGSDRHACTGEGACWVFIRARLNQFIYGLYPQSEYWRPNLALLLFTLLSIPLFIDKFPYKKWALIGLLIIYPGINVILLHGGWFGLLEIETPRWGGLMLTLIMAAIGMILSFPLGILLALGRLSKQPLFKAASTAFIELIRGVPLITILFMASVMFPLFMPEGIDFDKMVRALIGITLFQSAYMAEVIRGGLRAVPKGQYEAATALGMNYWQRMLWIILPQALKVSIPGIVNTFIGLIKDTTLVVVIGLLDLLGIVQAVLSDPDWLGYATEGYVFIAFIFWLLCFSISRYSQHIERTLQTDRP
ncbi:amino acid ABC transporter permease [Magnetococcales bacterium HHB-1]